jgi:hypothetical protein
MKESDAPRNRLRFTGEWPPQVLWAELPNWGYALDEEHVEGQDETTLRPAAVQDRITDDVAFTVGSVRCANDVQFPALLEVCLQRADGVTAFPASAKPWRIVRLGRPARWTSFEQSWLPEDERGFAPVSLSDSAISPVLVESRLPTSKGQTIRILVHGDGGESHSA